MDEASKALSEKIKNQINAPSNQNRMAQILMKMGRVLAKKQSFQSERPVLVYDDRIWLGNYAYANDRQFLLENKIKKVVSCLQLPLSLHLPEISYSQYILKDQEDERFGSLLQDFYRAVNESKENVFVHCFSGKSRSVAFMIYFLMKKGKMGYQEAKVYLQKVYPLTKPNQYFQSVLKSKENSLQKEEKEQSIDLLDISTQSPKKDQNSLQKNQPVDNILDSPPSSQKDYSLDSSNLLQAPILSQKLVQNSNENVQLNPDYHQLMAINRANSSPQFQNLIQMQNNTKPVEANLLDFKDDSQRNQIDLVDIESKPAQINQANIEKPSQQIVHKNEQTNLLQIQDESEVMIENANFSQKKSKKGNKKKKK